MLRKFIKLLRLCPVPLFRRGLRHGVAATIENRDALKGRGFRTVVDIGANKGQFALLARALFPDARILSFEPLPGPGDRFHKLFEGDERTSLIRAAVGPREERATIYVSRSDDSSSLLPIGKRQSETFPNTELSHTATVHVTPLDRVVTGDEIDQPALLKLDVQGYELEALKGCETLLDRFAAIYAECSYIELYEGQALVEEVVGWLGERGFRLAGSFNVARDRSGDPVQADLLFTRASA